MYKVKRWRDKEQKKGFRYRENSVPFPVVNNVKLWVGLENIDLSLKPRISRASMHQQTIFATYYTIIWNIFQTAK